MNSPRRWEPRRDRARRGSRSGRRSAEVSERVGISALLGRPLRGLSAGEATLVAIASAVAEQPILLLVDEPLADLDSAFRHRVVVLLDHRAGGQPFLASRQASQERTRS